MSHSVTAKLRVLLANRQNLAATWRQQQNCPSRGFDEDAHIRRMVENDDAIEAELDALDQLTPNRQEA